MRSSPKPVDVHVGRRLKLRRTLLGMSQERLAQILGVTFQQIQKYERGANRVGSSRLYDIANALDVPVAFFFEDLEDRKAHAGGLAESATPFDHGPTMVPEAPDRRDALELMRAFGRIDDPELRRRLLDLTKALAELDDPAGPRDGGAS